MELVKHAIDFSQRDVEGAVEVSLYKVRSSSSQVLHPHAVDYPAEVLMYARARLSCILKLRRLHSEGANKVLRG